MKAAHMAQLALYAVATDVGIAKNATDKEETHAAGARSPMYHAFRDPQSLYALPLPGQAATPDPLSSPPRGEGHLSEPANVPYCEKAAPATALMPAHGEGLNPLTEVSSALGGREQ
jgi:hypothetical protein